MAEVDLAHLARSVVRLRAEIPEDAVTAGILGSQRVGNGVIINEQGMALTIGYLMTEAKDVWMTTAEGRELAGHPFAYDQVTGFGLVMPLENPALPPIALGSSASVNVGDRAHAVSAPGFGPPQPVQVFARREFAGYWEYLLDEALFAMPAHPHWSGAALLGAAGELLGIGSLLIREDIGGEETAANMFVPIDLLKPILGDLLTHGHAARAARPWLGVYAVEMSGNVYLSGVAQGSPAQQADLREGDLISRVADHEVSTLPEFYRRLWAVGPAGTGVPLTAIRDGVPLHINVRSVDRAQLLHRPAAN